MGTSERIAELVEPILLDRGHELYDVELTGATVRVLVENPEGPVDLGVLETLSRDISTALDEADPLPDRFYLEVSSPGLERPLRAPRHFERAVGSPVKVKTKPVVEGERRVDGTLVAADPDGFTVETASGPRHVAYDDVERARTVFEWGASSSKKPAKSGSTKKRSAS